MNTILLIIFAIFFTSCFLVYSLWIFFLAVMNLEGANDKNLLGSLTTNFAKPIEYIGLFNDFLVNVFVLTPLFAEFPREWLVTSRLRRLAIRHTKTWRRTFARYIATNFLNSFDPRGPHVPFDKNT